MVVAESDCVSNASFQFIGLLREGALAVSCIRLPQSRALKSVRDKRATLQGFGEFRAFRLVVLTKRVPLRAQCVFGVGQSLKALFRFGFLASRTEDLLVS